MDKLVVNNASHYQQINSALLTISWDGDQGPTYFAGE